MVRIFLPLSFLSAASLVAAFMLGLMIDDPKSRSLAVQAGIQNHFLVALAALIFSTLVHAITLTYFMGTGRWIEETSSAYRLGPDFHRRSARLKYRTIPLMVLCFVLLVLTGAMGAASDAASPMQAKGVFGLSTATVHLTLAITTVVANLFVSWLEFRALEQNGEIVDEVLAEVHRIRASKGLAI